MSNLESESFVLNLFLKIFSVLRAASLSNLISQYKYKPKKKDDKNFIDGYVIFFTIISFILLLSFPYLEVWIANPFFVALGFYRIFEIITVQSNALFFDYYRRTKNRIIIPNQLNENEKSEPYQIRGYTRISLLLLLNFMEIIFWFAIIYSHNSFLYISNQSELNLITALSFSFYTMTTFGNPSAVSINGTFGYVLNMFQSVIGAFMALLILARFIALLPKAPTADEIEKKMEQKCCNYCEKWYNFTIERCPNCGGKNQQS